MKRVHYTSGYLVNPTHPVTISLVGCGGTGSQVLSSLARIHAGLQSLGHPGIHVTAYDDDIVNEANIGRQLFSPSDIGLNKAVILVSRINRFFGLGWKAEPIRYNGGQLNITISCVDSAASRLEIKKLLYSKHRYYEQYESPYYCLDFGNTRNSGQVILGTISDIKQPKSKLFKTVKQLPCIWDRFDLTKVNEEDSGPSCSLAEAINKQDLFINSTLTQLGCNLLWKLITESMTEHAGLYLNLKTLKVNPIAV